MLFPVKGDIVIHQRIIQPEFQRRAEAIIHAVAFPVVVEQRRKHGCGVQRTSGSIPAGPMQRPGQPFPARQAAHGQRHAAADRLLRAIQVLLTRAIDKFGIKPSDVCSDVISTRLDAARRASNVAARRPAK